MNNENLILLLSDLDKLCIDAYLYNNDNKVIAYKTAKGINDNSLDVSTLIKRSNNWLQSERIKSYISLKKPDSLQRIDNQDVEFDKLGLISELAQLYQKTTDIKLKSDILLKLADLKGYKKEKVIENQQVRYYLPVSCNICKFHPESK